MGRARADVNILGFSREADGGLPVKHTGISDGGSEWIAVEKPSKHRHAGQVVAVTFCVAFHGVI